jgi:hypothetical protein
MAGKGPLPKPPGTKHGHHKPPTLTLLHGDGLQRGPELDGDGWSERTVAWWESWRRSPQAQTFTDTDWDFLRDTALLHDMFWRGKSSVAGELRLRVAKFGATPEDRARLRLQIADQALEQSKPAARSRVPARERHKATRPAGGAS